jgi:hypothetical protein
MFALITWSFLSISGSEISSILKESLSDELESFSNALILFKPVNVNLEIGNSLETLMIFPKTPMDSTCSISLIFGLFSPFSFFLAKKSPMSEF